MDSIFVLLSLTFLHQSYALVELGVIQEGIYKDYPKLLTLDNAGLKTCARKCLYHKSCHAVNYNTGNLTCILLTNRGGTPQMIQDPHSIFSYISTWSLIEDVCYPNPCNENEQCIKTKAGSHFCKTDASMCRQNTCHSEGGYCSSEESLFQCRCFEGYSGTFCHLSVCDSITCFNGGTCKVDVAFTSGYKCICPERVYGEDCECPQCECGWLFNDSRCFHLSDVAYNWNTGKSYCAGLDSIMAEPQTRATIDFLSAEARKRGQSFWLGGNDIAVEGEFRWASTGMKIIEFDWGGIEPNNAGGNEHCLDILRTISYKWNDAACSAQLRVICEKDP